MSNSESVNSASTVPNSTAPQNKTIMSVLSSALAPTPTPSPSDADGSGAASEKSGFLTSIFGSDTPSGVSSSVSGVSRKSAESAAAFKNRKELTSAAPTDEVMPHLDKDVDEAIFEFFSLKRKYEENQRAFRKMRGNARAAAAGATKTRPKCVKCKRFVGNIFKVTKNTYEAKCGSTTEPCGLDIYIYRNTALKIDDSIKSSVEYMDSCKEEIILTKLNIVFGYVTEAVGIKLVEKELNDYVEAKENHKVELEYRNDTILSDKKAAEMKRLKSEIEEHIKSIQVILKKENRDFEQVNGIYKEELMPKVRMLRDLKYEVMEMNGGVLYTREISPEKEFFIVKNDRFVSKWNV